jgi:hypothetical protein
MSVPEHSPLPWRSNIPRRSGHVLLDHVLLCSHIVDRDGSNVAQLAHHADENIEANARLIATAVNAHDDLLSANGRLHADVARISAAAKQMAASHAGVLAAAKMFLAKQDRFRREALQAAIAAAEEPAP